MKKQELFYQLARRRIVLQKSNYSIDANDTLGTRFTIIQQMDKELELREKPSEEREGEKIQGTYKQTNIKFP